MGRRPVPLHAFSVAFLALAGCGTAPDRDPAIGQAFAGPAILELHKEIDLKSPVAATAKHGEKLEILAQRRRMYRVRTPRGVEGWTLDTGLLDTAQMNRLRRLAKETEDLPSQGVATTFDALHVHTEPNRQAPSFLQIAANEKVDVIAHKVMVRAAPPRRELIPPKPKAQRGRKKQQKTKGVPPPAPPDPPSLPKDWVALSKARTLAPDEDQPPAAHDDWTLIRNRQGQSGWVLTSRLYMAIPDEVAQYAEGHRITSYFSVGKIHDAERGVDKDIWLWTTAESLGEDHDFDGYRVFVWSLRHHRYETAYIQRRIRGYFPVAAKTADFSVCLDNENGAGRVTKHYVMLGNAVKLDGITACAVPTAEESETGIQAHIEVHAPPPVKKSWSDRIRSLFRR